MGKAEFGSEEVKQKYQSILADRGITKEIKDVITVEPDLRGEHMASACDYVTIKFTDGSEDLELFLKKFVNSPTYTEFSKEMAIFDKEAEFFNSLLPDAKMFCIANTGNDNLINYFPKSYYGDNEIIVLENLIKRDYFMLDKADKQDFHQAEIVLKNLARFHGVFHAMIREIGIEEFSRKYPYTRHEAFLTPKIREMMSPFFDNGFSTCISIVEANDLENGKEAVEWVKGYIGKGFDVMCELVKYDPEDPISVINHGDCWNNNMMFLKDKDGNIIDHLLIDMQIIRYGSPALDLGYFLFTSVKPEVRSRQWKSLLKTYFETFQKTVSTLGFSTNFTFDDLVKTYKKKCLLGIFMALSVMSTIGAYKDVDLEKFPSDPEEATEFFKQIIATWVEKHPENAKSISQEVIGIVEEYKEMIGE